VVVVTKGLGRIMRYVYWGKCGHPSQKFDCADYVYTTHPPDSSSMCCVKHSTQTASYAPQSVASHIP